MGDQLSHTELERRDAFARRWLNDLLAAHPDVDTEAVGFHVKLTQRGKWIGWYMRDHHGDGRISMVLRCEPDRRHVLEAVHPETFGGVPYVGKRPRIGAWLDHDAVAWDSIEDVFASAVRATAAKVRAR
ncbi:MAG: hypothetical protein SFX74_02000 [Fimbriimonadaceae bacterium]|nr:hypothetical protein [Fimbriimonadaceae bacterium]